MADKPRAHDPAAIAGERRRSPSYYRRLARRAQQQKVQLAELLHDKAIERQARWAEGRHPNDVERLTTDLDRHYAEWRVSPERAERGSEFADVGYAREHHVAPGARLARSVSAADVRRVRVR